MLLRVAIPILNGDFHVSDDGVGSYIGDQLFLVQQKQEQPLNTNSLEPEPDA
jgi:hypothetical protein